MTFLRAMLALLWVVFSLTSTAHAGTMTASEPACHMAATEMANMTKAGKTGHAEEGAMSCCSQPVIIAPADTLLPVAAAATTACLSPSPALPLTGTLVPYDPHPPKLG